MTARLARHVANGKITQEQAAAAQRIHVPGGKLAREIAEQLEIDARDGIEGLENVVNPIGQRRWGVMPNQPYGRPGG